MKIIKACLALLLCLNLHAQANEPVTIGLNYPRTGSYKEEGLAQMRAALLAVDEINARGGVLGRPLRLSSADTASRPEKAVRNVDKLAAEGAVMLFGGASSAVAIASGNRAREKGLLYFGTLTYSNDTTGKDGQRLMFRECNNAWMSAKVLAQYLNQAHAGQKFYYVTSDYTWGNSTEESLRRHTGTQSLAEHPSIKVRFPGALLSEYQDALAQVQASDAKVLVLALFGEDLVRAMRIADNLGLNKRMQIVAPNLTQSIVEQAGPALTEGVVGTEPWTWRVPALEGSSAGTAFVRSYSDRYQAYPSSSAASAYSIVYQWADAVGRARTFDSAAVARALEGHSYSLLKGPQQWRAFDHQNVQTVYAVRIKPRAEVMKDPLRQDYFEIIGKLDGAEAAQTLEEWQAERRAGGQPLTLQ